MSSTSPKDNPNHPENGPKDIPASDLTVNHLLDTMRLRVELDGGMYGISGILNDVHVGLIPLDIQESLIQETGSCLVGEISEFEVNDGIDTETVYSLIVNIAGKITLEKYVTHKERINVDWENIPKDPDGLNVLPDSMIELIQEWLGSEEAQVRVEATKKSDILQEQLGLTTVSQAEAERLVEIVANVPSSDNL